LADKVLRISGHHRQALIVRRIANNGLIKNLELERKPNHPTGDGSEVAVVSVATNPDGRADRQFTNRILVKPFIKLNRAASDERMGGASHFFILGAAQNIGAFIREYLATPM
jgi:hypothetical protein